MRWHWSKRFANYIGRHSENLHQPIFNVRRRWILRSICWPIGHCIVTILIITWCHALRHEIDNSTSITCSSGADKMPIVISGGFTSTTKASSRMTPLKFVAAWRYHFLRRHEWRLINTASHPRLRRNRTGTTHNSLVGTKIGRGRKQRFRHDIKTIVIFSKNQRSFGVLFNHFLLGLIITCCHIVCS